MKRILVLDDEIDFMDLLKFALEMTGDYEVRQVHSALRTVEVAREFQPDVILLDCMMPEMDGETVAAKLQLDPVLKNTPYIYITAKVGEPTLKPDSQGRMQTYLPKPLRLPVLIQHIEEKTAARSVTAEQ